MAIQDFTPSVLRDLYMQLEDREAFLKLLADNMTVVKMFGFLSEQDKQSFLRDTVQDAETVNRIIDSLPDSEHSKLLKGRFAFLAQNVADSAMLAVIQLVVEDSADGQPKLQKRELIEAAMQARFGRSLAEVHQRIKDNLNNAVGAFKKQRDRKPSQQSVAIKNEALCLKHAGRTWGEIAETIWHQHPEWFPDHEQPDQFRDKPAQQAELLSRLKERIRELCR